MPKNCVNKTAYKSWELEAYIDGEDLPHVATHLALCLACAAEYQQLATLGAQIGSKLYRFDCPPTDDLRAYYWQELAAPVQAKIQTHLALCIHCTGEVNRIAEFTEADATQVDAVQVDAVQVNEIQKETAVERTGTLKESADTVVQNLRQQVESLVDKIDIVVATFVTPLSPQTADIALRGAEKEPSMLLFETDNTDISITLQNESLHKWTLIGQVLMDTDITNGELKLIAADRKIVEHAITENIDANGNFTVTHVHSGIYQAIFQLNQRAILIPNLTIE